MATHDRLLRTDGPEGFGLRVLGLPVTHQGMSMPYSSRSTYPVLLEKSTISLVFHMISSSTSSLSREVVKKVCWGQLRQSGPQLPGPLSVGRLMRTMEKGALGSVAGAQGLVLPEELTVRSS